MRIPEMPDKDLRAMRSAMNSDLTTRVPIVMQAATKQKFKFCCDHNKTSMTAVVNKHIEAYIKKHYEKAVERLNRIKTE